MIKLLLALICATIICLPIIGFAKSMNAKTPVLVIIVIAVFFIAGYSASKNINTYNDIPYEEIDPGGSEGQNTPWH